MNAMSVIEKTAAYNHLGWFYPHRIKVVLPTPNYAGSTNQDLHTTGAIRSVIN